MKLANYTDPQFLDASAPGGLNGAFGLASGSIAGLGSGVWATPGLLFPEAMTVSFSSMIANIGLPRPWGIVAASGAVVDAHGTQTGLDTQSYTVDFSPLVPGGGSITAYLAAVITAIQQNPVPIPGPPPGHPAYNPNLAPFVGYTTNVYSVALSAVTGGIDNVTTFELLRTTLTAGQTSVTGWSTIGQVRAGDYIAKPANYPANGGMLTANQAQEVQVFSAANITLTLPPTSGCAGLTFDFYNPFINATNTIAVAGGLDAIFGLGLSGAVSVVLPPRGSISLWCEAITNTWRVAAAGPTLPLAPNMSVLSTNGFKFIPDINSPNGYMLEQWGEISAPANNTPTLFALPIAFPNAFNNIVISFGALSPPVNGVVGAQPSGLANFVAVNTSTAGGVNGAFWRALGN